MKLQEISANPRNPRKISDEEKAMLKKSMDEFGDLSGLVHNVRDNTWIGGHQRNKNIPEDSEIVIRQKYDPPTRTGTVADGHIVIAGEKWNYRAVDWDAQRAEAAMISANKQGGKWDVPILNDLLIELENSSFDMELVGYTEDDLEKQLVHVSEHTRDLSGELEGDQAPDFPPEVEFSKELDEKNDYVVLLFDSKEDFKEACEKLGVKSEARNLSPTNHPEFNRMGVGRILSGRPILDRL